MVAVGVREAGKAGKARQAGEMEKGGGRNAEEFSDSTEGVLLRPDTLSKQLKELPLSVIWVECA